MEIKDCGCRIVVVDQGFVYVGQVKIAEGFVLVSNARNIRVWGTTKGLGELKDGPTVKTILDDCGEVLIPFGRVILFIACTKDW